MTRLADVLELVSGLLQEGKQRFALVGGIAVSVRTEPRFTRDIDLAVAVEDDAGAEALVKALTVKGLRPLMVVEHDAKKRLATVRLTSPGEERGIVTDLLFASSGIEAEIVAAAEPLEAFANVVVPVARCGHLIALKLLARDDTNRPQDASDLRVLIAAADNAEIARARQAIALITARGFHRDRDLNRALEEALH